MLWDSHLALFILFKYNIIRLCEDLADLYADCLILRIKIIMDIDTCHVTRLCKDLADTEIV